MNSLPNLNCHQGFHIFSLFESLASDGGKFIKKDTLQDALHRNQVQENLLKNHQLKFIPFTLFFFLRLYDSWAEKLDAGEGAPRRLRHHLAPSGAIPRRV